MAIYLFPKQKKIYEYIKQHIQKTGYAPTLQSIADAFGLKSLATVSEHLSALEKKGLIQRVYGEARGIRIIEEAEPTPSLTIDVPIVGFISAGNGIEPIEDSTSSTAVPADMVSKSKRTFILQVVGDSMIDAHIMDGDQVICEQVNDVNNGEIVVAIIDNELATLKRFYKEKNRVRLQPENESMDPIYATNVEIKGKVIGVIRKY